MTEQIIQNKVVTTFMTKKKIYLKKEDFFAEYYKSIEKGQPTDKFIEMFYKIAKRFVVQFHNKNKCDDDACVNYSVSEAWRKWNNFNEDRSDNIFSFYTTMIANDLMLHYKKISKGKKVNISIESLFTNNTD